MSDDAEDTWKRAEAREERCRKCGVEFEYPEVARDIGPDCSGCHLCYDCADNKCPVCGDGPE